MFRGIISGAVDDKHRISIPARYRSGLMCEHHDCSANNNQIEANKTNSNENKEITKSNLIVLTIDVDLPCLLIYKICDWTEIENKLGLLPTFDKNVRRAQHLLIGHATELEPDKNWRILLPSLLREYASIRKKIFIVGQIKKLEIWSENNWNMHRKKWLQSNSEEENSKIDSTILNNITL